MKGYVYFIQAGDDGPIKVGYTTHPEIRLGRLQVANPETLHLRAVIWVRERGVEVSLHKEFAAHRIRGEWFHPHSDLWAYIRRAADPFFALKLATPEPELDPALAPDDDDFNLELLEAAEESA